jgi:CheY-like chemotaxis protein
MQVLVVDDNVMDRKCVHYILEQHLHITPIMAKDGQDAINKINKKHFDLIVTDIVMPNIDGIELIRYIKSNFPKIKLIATTGNNPYYLRIAQILGVDQFFTKPFDSNKFVDYISSLIKQYPNPKCA